MLSDMTSGGGGQEGPGAGKLLRGPEAGGLSEVWPAFPEIFFENPSKVFWFSVFLMCVFGLSYAPVWDSDLGILLALKLGLL